MLMKRLRTIAQAAFLAAFVAVVCAGSWVSFQESYGGKVGPSGVQDAQAKLKNEQYGIWGHSDPGVTFVTLLLVAVGAAQVGLFLIQLRLIRESLIDAKKAADAAEKGADAARLNAEAVINAERPHFHAIIKGSNLEAALRPAVLYDNSPGMDDSFISTRPGVEFALKNLGKTHAVMTDTGHQLIQGTFDQKEWNYAAGYMIVDPVIEGGQETDVKVCQLESFFRMRDAKGVLEGDRPLYFYGHVTFLDRFNREYTYYWRYQSEGMRFVMVRSEEQAKKS